MSNEYELEKICSDTKAEIKAFFKKYIYADSNYQNLRDNHIKEKVNKLINIELNRGKYDDYSKEELKNIRAVLFSKLIKTNSLDKPEHTIFTNTIIGLLKEYYKPISDFKYSRDYYYFTFRIHLYYNQTKNGQFNNIKYPYGFDLYILKKALDKIDNLTNNKDTHA